MRKAYGCRIVAHPLDAAYLESGDSQVTGATWYGSRMRPLKVDVLIQKDPEIFQFEGDAIAAHHWPGHSPGSMVYTVQMEGKTVLFGQDVHGPIHPALHSDPEAYQASLRKLLELNADILCEGHYGVFKGKEAVKGFIQSFLRQQITQK